MSGLVLGEYWCTSLEGPEWFAICGVGKKSSESESMSGCGCVRTLGVKTMFGVTIAMSVGTVGFNHCRAFSASESVGGGESKREEGEGDEER